MINSHQQYYQFDSYVYTQFTQKNKSFCLVTDGADDLVYTLRKECALKHIRLPSYFDRFFDLCKEFNKFYPEYGARSLIDMAQCLGVVRKPDSSTMENCKIISNIVASVLREGYAFMEPEVIPVMFNPFATMVPLPYPFQRDLQLNHHIHTTPAPQPNKMYQQQLMQQQLQQQQLRQQQQLQQQQQQHQQQEQQHHHLDGEIPSFGDSPASKSRSGSSTPLTTDADVDSCVVRLRGLPWDAKGEDVSETESCFSSTFTKAYLSF
jgi:hypothetical protein